MFAKFLIVPLFIASSVVAVPTFVRRGDVSLSDWSSQNLESYWKFKMRYSSLDCASQTGTDFYNNCCSPLGATESLSDRPAECTPTTCAAPSTSAVQYTPTYDVASVPTTSAYDDDEDLPYCDDDENDDGDYSSDDSNGETSPAPQYDTPTPTPTDNNDPSSSQDDSQPTTTQAQDNSGPTPDTDTGNTGDVQSEGFATFYYQEGNAGACGDFHGNYDLIAAIDIDRYGDTGSKSSLCGQRVHIKNTENGNTVDVVIADVCPSCANRNSIDLSVGAFQALADTSEGQVPIEWSFI